ncbi:MAG: ribose-5-phosphate isomerase RpiA [Chloroflexota bacterium]
MSVKELKRAAGYYAAEWVPSGVVIGLGSGSTARYATLRIAERLAEGSLRDVLAVPTSEETAQLARQVGIPLTTLDEQAAIEITIDGADEVDPHLNVIKGHGGFLLREKIVAYATRHEVIIVDEGKLVGRLGERFAVPVEVVRFGWKATWAALERTGASVSLRRKAGQPYVTDEGHYILDCAYASIPDPRGLECALNTIPGVVENGLFVDMVAKVVVAGAAGVRVLERPPARSGEA